MIWKTFLKKSLNISKNTSIQQVLLIQLLPKNSVVTFQNMFVSCKISQRTFPSIMKYQPLTRKFRPFYSMLGHFTILYMKGLKSGKVSNDVDSELLKKYEHPLMLQVIDRMANNLWSNLDIPAVWGNSRLKTF